MNIKNDKKKLPEGILENTSWLCGFCVLAAATYCTLIYYTTPQNEELDIAHVPNFYRMFNVPEVVKTAIDFASLRYNN